MDEPAARVYLSHGTQVGRLNIVREAGRNRYGQRKWLCECECGERVAVLEISLARGTTRSCGCLRRDSSRSRARSRRASHFKEQWQEGGGLYSADDIDEMCRLTLCDLEDEFGEAESCPASERLLVRENAR